MSFEAMAAILVLFALLVYNRLESSWDRSAREKTVREAFDIVKQFMADVKAAAEVHRDKSEEFNRRLLQLVEHERADKDSVLDRFMALMSVEKLQAFAQAKAVDTHNRIVQSQQEDMEATGALSESALEKKVQEEIAGIPSSDVVDDAKLAPGDKVLFGAPPKWGAVRESGE